MKYISLIIGLLVVGCGKQEQTDTNESTPTTTEKPVKELTLREKVAGTYEFKEDGSITAVAVLSRKGEREEAPKEGQITAKNTK